ncbi:hypothetical protein MRX96_021040 [Rhipicephalus microplus]
MGSDTSITDLISLLGQFEPADSFDLSTAFSIHEGTAPAGHVLLQFPSSVQLIFTKQLEAGNVEQSGCGTRVIGPKPAVIRIAEPVHSESPKPRSRTAKERHKCHLCTKSFVTLRDLRTHLLKHQGHKPFHCHLCPATFLARGYLADHLQSHSKTKRWKCDECPRSFLRPAQLARHRERSHSNVL